MVFGPENLFAFGKFSDLHNTSDVTRGVRRTIPRARNHCRGPKSPNKSSTLFFKTVHLLPKDLRFEHGGVKLVSCPTRHLTSFRLCTSRLSSQNGNLFTKIPTH